MSENPKENSKPKTMTISIEELMKWDKKSKDLNQEIVNLKLANSKLTQALEEKNHTVENFQRRQSISMEGLEERCKALQEILDESSKKHSSLEAELVHLRQQNIALKNDFDVKESELKSLRLAAKDKFETERKLNDKLNECEEFKKRLKHLENELSADESIKSALTRAKSDIKAQEAHISSLKKCLEETNSELQSSKSAISILEGQLSLKEKSLESMKSEISSLNDQITSLKEEKSEVMTEREDLEAEMEITKKKFSNEIKELKSHISSLISKTQHLTEERENFKRDLQNVMDSRVSSKISSKATKEEKVILESLSMRNQELEMSILNFTRNQKEMKSEISALKGSLHEKEKINKKLLKLLYGEEISPEEMKTIEREFEREELGEEDLQQVANNLFIENSQLREQLLMLGSELNSMRRQENK